MASEGPKFPGTTANLSEASTLENKDAWSSPGNVAADDGTEATITAATFDSPDISQILVASNFGFANVAGTVNGITVEIDRRSIISGSGADFRVQLANGTTFASLVGNNKAATATVWPTTSTVATYGGAADMWGTSLTAADITRANFAVFLSASAKIANADIGVDFIRVTVTYTPPTNTSVTPGAASLTTTASAPAVAFTDNKVIAPGAASLTTTASAPTVAFTDHKTVLPGAASLSLTASAPAVAMPVVSQPGAASLILTPEAPAVSFTSGNAIQPGAASLTLTTSAPSVVFTDNKTVLPGAAALVLTASAPSVASTANWWAQPGAAALVLTGVAPDVINSGAPVTPPLTGHGGRALRRRMPVVTPPVTEADEAEELFTLIL